MEEAREALWYKGAYEIEVERNTKLEELMVVQAANSQLILAENERLERQNLNIKRVAGSLGVLAIVELVLIAIGVALHFAPSP